MNTLEQKLILVLENHIQYIPTSNEDEWAEEAYKLGNSEIHVLSDKDLSCCS